MNLEGTIYEAGGLKGISPADKDFIQKFMTNPKEEDYPLHDGQTNLDTNEPRRGKNNAWHGSKNEKGLPSKEARLQVFEVEKNVWSLNLAKEPEFIICQMDHNDCKFRVGDVQYSPYVATAFNFANEIFKEFYEKDRNEKHPKKYHKSNLAYVQTGDTIAFTPSVVATKKFITKLDISKWLKF